MNSSLKGILRGQETTLIEAMRHFLFQEQVDLFHGKLNKVIAAIVEAELNTKHAAMVIQQYTEKSKRDHSRGMFHPSQISGCLRSVYLSMINAPTCEPYDKVGCAKMVSIFGNGDYVHLRLQNLLDRMGVLKAREIPLEDTVLRIEGHADGIVALGSKDYVLEIKSINEYGFIALRDAKPEHKEQVNLYMHCLKIPRAFILYENKNRQEWKEYMIPFDTDLFKEQKCRIKVVEHALEEHVPPPKLTNKDGCRWCNFTDVCDQAGTFGTPKRKKVKLVKRSSIGNFLRAKNKRS